MNYPDNYRTLNETERLETWNRIQGSISHSSDINYSPYAPTPAIKKSFFSKEYALALICVILLSSTTSVAAAAEQSLPTSLLYPIKLHVTEPLRTLTKTTPVTRIDWEIKRTARRLEEARQLVETNQLTPEIAADLSTNIQHHTALAQEKINELSTHDSNQSTILSLSLVETIEQKQEEIVLANNETNLTISAVAALPNGNTLSSDISTETLTLENRTTLPESAPVSDPVSTILAAASQAQVSTNALIDTFALEIQPSSIQSASSAEIEPEPPANHQVITYSLVMSDIHDQILDIERDLDIAISYTKLPKEEPVDETTVEVEPTTTTTDDVLIQGIAALLGSNTTDEPTTDTESTLAPSTTETALKTNLLEAPTQEAGSQSTEKSTNPTDVSISSTVDVLQTETTATNNSEILQPAVDMPAAVSFEEALVTAEPTDTEKYNSIIAEYSRLQKVTQPTDEDIHSARTLRKKAQSLLRALSISAQTKPVDAVPTPNDSAVLPALSIESIQIPTPTTENNTAVIYAPEQQSAPNTPTINAIPVLNENIQSAELLRQ